MKRFTAVAAFVPALVCCLFLTSSCMTEEKFRRTTGKKHETRNYFVSPDPADLNLKRVIFVPLRNESSFGDAGRQVGESFRVELEKLNRFEIVSPQKFEKDLSAMDVFGSGRYSATDLYLIAKALNADGVLFGVVKQYRPYRPLMLGVKAQIVRADTGAVVWAVDDVFDASRKDVANRAYAYSYRTVEPLDHDKTLVILSSMKYFTSFVCHELLSTLAKRR